MLEPSRYLNHVLPEYMGAEPLKPELLRLPLTPPADLTLPLISMLRLHRTELGQPVQAPLLPAT